MLYFFLGIVTGLVMATISVLIALFLSRYGERIADVESKPEPAKSFFSPERAEIFEPTPPEIEAMEAVIKENEAKGRDTKLEEMGR